VLNGQGRVRKAPNQAFDAPNPESNGIASIDEASCFYGNPSQYNWSYIAKKEMLVPYNCNGLLFGTLQDMLGPHFPKPEYVRWEKHRVWVVEADLAPGENNINSKRRFYIDEDTWYALLGEGYDGQGDLVKAYAIYNECVPAMPGVIENCTSTTSLISGNYVFNGNVNYAPYNGNQYLGPQAEALFDPQQMAASASF